MMGLIGAAALVPASVMAQQPIGVTVDGDPVRFNDVQPAMISGRVLVPLRAVLEKMGAEVNYDPGLSMVEARRMNTVIKLRIGQTEASVNGKVMYLDVPAQTVRGRTMIPLRFFGEALGAEVQWKSYENMVAIQTNEGSTTVDNDETSGTPIPVSVQYPSDQWLMANGTVPITVNGPAGARVYAEIPAANERIMLQEGTAGRYTGTWQIPNHAVKPLASNNVQILIVIENNGRQQVIEGQTRLMIDNEEPKIDALSVAENATFAEARPAISATVNDRSGSGLDYTKTQVWLDGKDVSSRAYVRNGVFFFQPEADLQPGNHTLRMMVTDNVGNTSSMERTFSILNATALVSKATVNAGETLQPGEVITINVEGEKGARSVKAEIEGVVEPVTLQETSPGVYTARYTVTRNDRFDAAKVVINFLSQNGTTVRVDAVGSLNTANAGPAAPKVTSPAPGTEVGDGLVIEGTAAGAETVRIKITYRSNLFGVIPTTGTAYEGEAEVAEDGTFKTDGLRISRLISGSDTTYEIQVVAVSKSGKESSATTVAVEGK